MTEVMTPIEKFTELYCKKVKWIEKLNKQDYSNFLRVYLIPYSMLKVSSNEISLLHSLVLLLLKRSLKNKEKEIVFNPEKKEFVLKLLFLVSKYLEILRFKRGIFEDLKSRNVVSNWKDFSYIVFSTLMNLEQDEDEFEEFLEFLPIFLKVNKLSLSEDDKVEGVIIKVKDVKGGVLNGSWFKKETPLIWGEKQE